MAKFYCALVLMFISSSLCLAQDKTDKALDVTYEENKRTGKRKVVVKGELKTKFTTKALQLNLPKLTLNSNELPKQPKLSSKNVSFEQGVFGVKAGMKITDALALLGTPVSQMALNNTDVLYSFGRNLWLTAKENKVHTITTSDSRVSSTVKSMMAFDQRPLKDWTINGVIARGDSKSKVVASMNGTFTSENTFLIQSKTNISIEILFVRDTFSENADWLVGDFRYGSLTSPIALDADHITENTVDGYGAFTRLLNRSATNKEPVTLDDLMYSPIFTAYGVDSEKLYVYDNHLLVITKGKKIKRLYIAEKLFSGINKEKPWKLGNLYRHQASEEIASMFEGEVLGMDDYWEVYTENVKYDFYFKRETNNLVLDEVEIELF